LPVAVQEKVFALSTGGSLLDKDAGDGKGDTYDYPVPGPSVNTQMFEDAWGQQASGWRKGSLAYTSAPLAGTLVTYGPASADLWISSTATDTDLQVTLTELRPDGQEVFIQRGWLRASDRAVDPKASTPVRPVLFDKPETTAGLTPDEPALARVELNKFSHPFRAGSRIRMWIDTPSDTGEFGFNYVSLPAKNTIWHDEAHPSRLVIGILPDVTPPAERAPCGQMLKEPCRKDPLANLD
jgi:predicted acyl esterase